MNPDDFKHAWQTQVLPEQFRIDPDSALKQLQLKQQQFAFAIGCRDIFEAGIYLLLVPIWIFIGIRLALHWPWYLMIIGFLWIAGFKLISRRFHSRRRQTPSEPLRQCLESSLDEVRHQYRLLRNVAWWYLLPLAIPMLISSCHVAWGAASVWDAALFLVAMLVTSMIIFSSMYFLYQYGVRTMLEPRRQELETLLASLSEEPAGNGNEMTSSAAGS